MIKINSSVVTSRHAREIIVLISIASFFLYALAVLALHQDRATGWSIEAQGPIPVAISHLVYGTPLGALDHNVWMKFLHPNGVSVQEMVSAAAAGFIPRSQTDPFSTDGIGAGSSLFATLAMWMFGIKILSLVVFYISFVWISVLAFVWRYQDKRLLVVPFYFFVATVMLLTPLADSSSGISQNPIGGNRYFAMAAFLPTLHIFFELVEHYDGVRRKLPFSNCLLLFVQGILLFGALLVRSSTGYLLGGLLLALIWRLYLDQKRRVLLTPLAYKSAIVGSALVLWALLVAASMPAYVYSGRTLGNFWHRAFISFSIHPGWPFGDLRRQYDCTKYIPEGLNREHEDRNGHCIWWVYPPNATRPPSEVLQGTYGGEYEKALRNAYFYVVAHYPQQAFELYFFIKPRMIKDTLTQAWNYLFQISQAPVTRSLFVILLAQLAVFISFIISTALIAHTVVDRRMIIFPIFFLLSLAPRLVAWSSWQTGADMIFLMYSCLVLAALLPVQLLMMVVRHANSVGQLLRRA